MRLGSAIIATSITVFVFDGLSRNSFLAEISGSLKRAYKSTYPQISRLNNAGVKDAFEILPHNEMLVAMESADRVDILQSWIPEVIPIRNALSAVVKRRGQIRILLLKPNSTAAKLRSNDLGYPAPTSAKKAIESNAVELAMTGLLKENIKFSDRYPTIWIYRIDNIMYVGSFHRGLPAIQSPCIKVEKPSKFFDAYMAHFEALWNESQAEK